VPNKEHSKFCSRECYRLELCRRGQERRGSTRCEHCQTYFDRRKYNQRYCCTECYYEQARERKRAKKAANAWEAKQLQCPFCTAFFKQVNHNHLFCSARCRINSKKHEVYLRLKAKSPTECKTCKGPLPRFGLIYCSVKCRNKNKWVARQIHHKQCATCGAQFKSHNIRAINCSRKCSNRYTNSKKAHERLLAEQGERKRQELRETQERRVTLSRQMPGETAYSDAIKAYLKRGGKITQYQPQEADEANLAVPQNFWSYDQYDAEI